MQAADLERQLQREAEQQILQPSQPDGESSSTPRLSPKLLEERRRIERSWRIWVREIAGDVLYGEFAKPHAEFWDWFWANLKARREGRRWEGPSVFLGIWGRGMGKCLAETTEVLCADGLRRPIRDVAVGQEILALNEQTGRFEVDRISQKWDSGIKSCNKIKTKSGWTVTLTPEHEVLTFDGWKRAGELTTSDRIASPRTLPTASTETRSDAEVKLLGYMLAEGGTAQRGYVINATFTNADEVVVKDFTEAAEACGFKVRRESRYSYGLSNGIRDWLRSNGLAGKKAIDKRMPEWAFRLPERQKWLLLAALFDTDGYVSQGEGKLGIDLANPGLIADIRYLLLQVGVVTNAFVKQNKHAGCWSLLVDAESIPRCVENLPLILKGEKLRAILDVPRYSLIDTYPSAIWRNLPRGMNRQIRRISGLKCTTRYDATRVKVRRALQVVAFDRWQWLEQAHVLWDKIKAIEDAGEHRTFDVEVERHHNFIADGLVSHNSANAEISAIAEGAIIGEGYVLYVSGTQPLAQQHLGSIADLIESESVRYYYPELATPKTRRNRKQQQGWSSNFLHTAGGWGIRAYGLDVGVRGGRLGKLRPTLIVLDDVDELDDSPGIVQKKINRIARSILPAAGLTSTVLGVQNLIHAGSVFNQIYTRKIDILADRVISGPYPAFDEVRIERKLDKWVIVSAKPTWSAFDMRAAQEFLSRSGREAFLAEYQHDVDAGSQDLVIPEFDPKVHLITWSEFARVFGSRWIPAGWEIHCGHDFGSTGPKQHPAVLSFVATSPEDTPVPGVHFLFGAYTSQAGETPADLTKKIHEILGPREELGKRFSNFEFVRKWLASHEAKGVRDVYRRDHGIPFVAGPTKDLAGLVQLRQFLAVDYKAPHPFRPGAKGYTPFYWIVDDDQLEKARDDRGLFRHREEIADWRWRVVQLADSGLQEERPVKFRDDAMDSLRFIAAGWMPRSVPKTREQRIEEALPAQLTAAYLAQLPDRDKADFLRMLRAAEVKEIEKQLDGEEAPSHWLDAEMTPAWKEEEALRRALSEL